MVRAFLPAPIGRLDDCAGPKRCSAVLFPNLVAFLEDAPDRLAGLLLGAVPNHLENGLKPVHMPLGFIAMGQEG
jgi:hypothetical protein